MHQRVSHPAADAASDSVAAAARLPASLRDEKFQRLCRLGPDRGHYLWPGPSAGGCGRGGRSASVALLVPVFAGVAAELGMPRQMLVMVIGIGASCAFMLPVATPPNAIVFGSGLIRQQEMMGVGLVLNLLSAAVVSLWAYFLL